MAATARILRFEADRIPHHEVKDEIERIVRNTGVSPRLFCKSGILGKLYSYRVNVISEAVGGMVRYFAFEVNNLLVTPVSTGVWEMQEHEALSQPLPGAKWSKF